jgi:hypothetical protein
MAGAGVAAILRGVVCGRGKGVGEVVGFGDAIWLSGVVSAGNADEVVTDAAGFCWWQNFSRGAPLTERDTSQGISLHWKKPFAPHRVTARECSRHWQGLTQVTVTTGGAGVGVPVAAGVTCRKSVRVSVSAPEAVPALISRIIITRKRYV